ncbi:autotransporter family porin/fibronectin-binding autotransporter adhesin [Luteimonas cucumeris]|uniref:Autotransporter family porin/fibronectin-binding autotransporter adhesin n=1 Tax=Luteimonas cucumeris TaxID=985012 RepID=A0A562LAI1_9GAMM|nr:autotransporter outer membrane beta-barrel domain-containing protein [Luteimonas cucumeris]TWI04640.1 autotransporter family porin/fibronectin-binding autotransporter adhesin [Luteimonas cucumeris]
MNTFSPVAVSRYTQVATSACIELAGRRVSAALPTRLVACRRHALSLGISMVCAGAVLAVAPAPCQAEILVVTDSVQTAVGPNMYEAAEVTGSGFLTVIASSTLQLVGGAGAPTPFLTVQSGGSVNQQGGTSFPPSGTDYSAVLLGNGGVVTNSGSYTMSGNAILQAGTAVDAITGGVKLINNGTFTMNAVTTQIADISPPGTPAPAGLMGVVLGSLAGGGVVRIAAGPGGTVALQPYQLLAGYDNSSTAFSGTMEIDVGAAFTKIGAGTMTINDATFSGPGGNLGPGFGTVYVAGGGLAQTSGDTNATYLSIGTNGGNEGMLTVSGGDLTVGTALQIGDFGGIGTVNQSGGNVLLTPRCGNSANCVGLNIGNQGGTGTYAISGGTLVLEDGFLVLGRTTANPTSGTLNIGGSAEVTIRDGAVPGESGQMVIGNNQTGTTSGTGVVNQDSGTLTVENASQLWLAGSGSGTYNLNGGTLRIGGNSLQGVRTSGGAYAFNLGGGTVQALGSSLITAVNANLTADSTLDTNGLGITWNGMLGGAGGLDKTGGGTLTLNAVNTYKGPTTITEGTLALGASGVLYGFASPDDFANARVTIAEGAAFDIQAGGSTLPTGGTGSAIGSLAGAGSVDMQEKVLLTGLDNTNSAFSGTVNMGATGTFIKVGTGTMTINDSRFGDAAGNTNAIYVGQGALAQTAGNTEVTRLSIGFGASAGVPDVGALEVEGGTLTVGTALQVGDFGGAGTVNHSGGAVILTPRCGTPASCVGLNIGNQGGTGTYNLSGGTLAMDSGFLVVGRNTTPNPASTGVLNINGGQATLTNVQMVIGNNNSVTAFPSSNGTVNQEGGTLTIGAGSNLYLAGSGQGTYNLTGGTLQVGGGALIGPYLPAGGTGSYTFNLGGGTVQAFDSALTTDVDANLTATSTLDTNGLGITWNGMLGGNGGLNKAGAGILRLTAANTYSGGTNVLAGTLAVDRNDELGSGTVTLSEGGAVAVAAAGDFTFNNALASATPGAGLFSVMLADPANAFEFANDGGGYSGTVQLGTGQFALSGTNTSALAAATLQLDSGNTTTVGAGVQATGNLTLNGGRLDFLDAAVALPTSITADSSISTGDLVLDSGDVAIDFSSSDLVENLPGATGDGNLLSQDDDVQLQLISASGTVTGSASNLNLLNLSPPPAEIPQTSADVDVEENGNTVAIANYDFIFNTVDGLGGQGLFVGYGLRQLDLQAGQTLTLSPAAGATGRDTDLAALLTGLGNLAIDAEGNAVSLSNSANDYGGETHVLSGTLRLGNDGVLGLTPLLDIASGATVDVNGRVQAIGKLVTHAGSRLDLDGTLTITDSLRAGGDPSGGMIESATLFGAGTFNIDPSIVEVSGANADYSGDVNVTEGSQLILNNTQGLGTSGLVTLAGAGDLLTFAQIASAPGVSAQGSFSKQLAGSGTVQLQDAAEITLEGDNSGFSGRFDIASGTTLAAGQAAHLGQAAIGNEGMLDLSAAGDWMLGNTVTGSGTLNKSGPAMLTVDQALAGFAGLTHIQTGTLQLVANGAMAGSASIASGASLLLLDGAAVGGDVDNAGTLQANSGAASVGSLDNAGTVVLAGPSIGNTLTVLGDYAGNSGALQINTVLGNDDSPTDQLVVLGAASGSTSLQVGGVAGATPGTTQEGIRVVRVDGASDGVFTLAGRAVGGAFDFRLFQGSVSDPADGDWYLRAAGIRPEVGGYLGNQYAAVTMLQQTMRERMGEPVFVAHADKGVNGWIRIHRKQFQSGVEAGGLGQDMRGDTNLLQGGAGVVRSAGSQSAWQAGVMLSHGEATADSTSFPLGFTARGRVDGDAIGGYGTWLANAEAGTGFYVDGWLQYARFDNTVRGEGLVEESYDSDSWVASAEAGYGIVMRQGATSSLYLEPQVQLIYTDYSVDDHVERGGTVVNGGRAGGLTSRVGVRLHGRSNSTDWSRFQPFIEANFWNNGRDNEVVFDGQRLQQRLPDDVYEGRAGLEAEFDDRWSGWAALGLQRGSHDYRNVSAGFGLRASW